jgi:ribonuclease kappa
MSAFAIVILSVIGLLFKSNHHSMMGSTEDPPDGAAVAATVFSAVVVYAVRSPNHILYPSLALGKNAH